MRIASLALILAALTACTSFTAVRSAEVRPDHAFHAMASVSSEVGDEAGWFYSLDCASSCDTPVGTLDLGWEYGMKNASGTGATLGIGLSGLFPYFEGYWQLGKSAGRPYGVGARFGLPISGWSEHRVFGRFDFPTGNPAKRILWNPGLMMHVGNSPNGENAGSLIALTNGFGIESGTDRFRWTPSLSVVTARAGHRSFGQDEGFRWSTFAVAGVGITYRP